jgi:hypothetical protein
VKTSLLAPLDRGFARPVRIVSLDDGARGARLGGRAPALVEIPHGLRDDAEWFFSAPIGPEDADGDERFVSVWLNSSFEDRLALMNHGVVDDARVLLVPHAMIEARRDDKHASRFAAFGLSVGDPVPDRGEDGASPLAAHKIGGRAFCIQEPELPGSEAIVASGFVHLFQLDFASADDDADLEGSWPFADGMFNVYGRAPFASTSDFRWAFQK